MTKRKDSFFRARICSNQNEDVLCKAKSSVNINSVLVALFA